MRELLRTLPRLDRSARASLDVALEADVRLYASHHLAELGADRLGVADERALVESLRLVGLSVTAGEGQVELSADYSVDPELTQCVLAVEFGASGDVAQIKMEN